MVPPGDTEAPRPRAGRRQSGRKREGAQEPGALWTGVQALSGAQGQGRRGQRDGRASPGHQQGHDTTSSRAVQSGRGHGARGHGGQSLPRGDQPHEPDMRSVNAAGHTRNRARRGAWSTQHAKMPPCTTCPRRVGRGASTKLSWKSRPTTQATKPAFPVMLVSQAP